MFAFAYITNNIIGDIMIFIFLLVFLIIVLFLLFYPFKYEVWNKNEYLYIKTWLITIKVNLLILFDNNHTEELKKQAKLIKLYEKINIETLDIELSGLSFDYEYSGIVYGYLNILFPIIKNYFLSKKCDFNYKLEYMGKRSFAFRSIFYCKTGTILKKIGGK